MNHKLAKDIREASTHLKNVRPREHGRMLLTASKKAPRGLARPLEKLEGIGDVGMRELLMAVAMMVVENEKTQ